VTGKFGLSLETVRKMLKYAVLPGYQRQVFVAGVRTAYGESVLKLQEHSATGK
jgi:hypothetical protein